MAARLVLGCSVPILKKGKCVTAAESYRPSSLTSVISKTMGRMGNARLYHYLEQSACLDESQSGFRRHRTTVDQLVRFTQSVINAWQAQSHTVAVNFDLEKTYDRVWRTGLQLMKLQEHGITGRMYRWLKAFLTERFISTRIVCEKGQRSYRSWWAQTPQSLRMIDINFKRPVLEFANPVLNLARRKSPKKLDRVQNAALRLVLRALWSTPIATLELAAGCDPFSLRRGEQTV
ncbi:reverse transcriptase-like protein [Plakobranchus ocellatus]|uniref:Reverse transcriptase-like protein n=1 Tax=Plakobranchus ocellatus TaxID=259542 RepID=A0AAV3YXV1_9GAST|nr:reverse transcriptase-like protein [Plakobranchus ocellatus]